VRIFLDENFPLGLERRLKTDGYEVEHVVTIGWRGAPDTRIRERLVDADLLFLTQDEDFLSAGSPRRLSCSHA
jgi:predicted nuclease of predicted toxin-antitoxin system